MEGKEGRLGIGASALAAVASSHGATGATNSAHDSYTPLGGLALLTNMLLGEMVLGGLGTGMYGLLMVALLGLFITGLMVGRTPASVGKKIGVSEIRLIAIDALIGPAVIFRCSALAVATSAGASGLTSHIGPHGLSEIVYAFTSTFASTGQVFAGLSTNTPFYTGATVFVMLLGRFAWRLPPNSWRSDLHDNHVRKLRLERCPHTHR
jgi:K+-transporting ATPase ATPase A chain